MVLQIVVENQETSMMQNKKNIRLEIQHHP